MNELNKSIIEKAHFYKEEKIKCHVITIPKGTFKNGFFESGLIEKKYFWFISSDGIPFRLFLNEIFDIEEYKQKEEEQ